MGYILHVKILKNYISTHFYQYNIINVKEQNFNNFFALIILFTFGNNRNKK